MSQIHVKNWQFCDGSHHQDGIMELGVPNDWYLRFVDNQPIPVVDPPINGLRPESLCVSIWDVGGEWGKFGQSPPNPGQYNTVFKIHKWAAPFAFELVQQIGGFTPGKRYRASAWFFPDFYDGDGNIPEYYAAACGIAVNREVGAWHWAGGNYDSWMTVTHEFTATANSIELGLAGFSKWGLPGNTWWLHGLRIEEIAAETPVEPPVNPPVEPPASSRGKPRVQYPRTYLLLHADEPHEMWLAAMQTVLDLQQPVTIGPSADDAGLGDLDYRRIIALNPALWGDSLADFYTQYYPGVELELIYAVTPADLALQLERVLRPAPPIEPPVEPPLEPLPLPTDLRGMQVYSQRDSRWAADKMGLSNLTIGQAGCAMVSACMRATQVAAINPKELNQRLGTGGYTSDGLLYWAAVAAAVPGLRLKHYYTWRATPKPDADMNIVHTAIAASPTVIQVDLKPQTAALDTHFVVAVRALDNDIQIIDPLDGQVTTLMTRYNKGTLAQSIYAMAVYENVTSPPQQNPGKLITLHLQTCEAPDIAWVSRVKPNVVKYLNSAGNIAGALKAAAPNTKVVYRHWFTDHDIMRMVEDHSLIDWAFSQIPGYTYDAVNAGQIDYVETFFNEANQWYPTAVWAAADTAFVNALARYMPKAKPVTMCLSVGWPAHEPDYALLVPLARLTTQRGGAGGYHAYFGVHQGQRFSSWAPWHEYRFERLDRIFRQHGVQLPWILGEGGACGMTPTGQFDPHAGWQDAYAGTTTEKWAAYKKHLDEFETDLRKSTARVLGCTLFTVDKNASWPGFHIGPEQLVSL